MVRMEITNSTHPNTGGEESMKKIFTGSREFEQELWQEIGRWVQEKVDSMPEGGEYLNKEMVVIIETHREEKL